MKPKLVLASLIGSLSVYSAMVACSKSPELFGGTGAGGSAGENAQGGQTGQGGEGGSDTGGEDDAGIMDALMDAVPDAAADPVSGSRLKAKYRLGEDGSKSYLDGAWYDSQRQEDCYFGSAGDGKDRCLPAPALRAIGGYYFSDTACTAPVAYFAAGCTPKYASSTLVPPGCANTSVVTQVFAIGAKVNSPSIYVKSGASCISTVPTPGYEYYEVGAEIPPTSFVAGTVMVDL